jgi:hypothetical protein
MRISEASHVAPDLLRPRIDVFDAADVKRWATRFGVSPADVVAAVRIYGSAADAVQRGLDRPGREQAI